MMLLQLKEAEERRLSRSCSKSPGIRSQDSPIQFPTAVNPPQKTPELKITEVQDSTTIADPKTPELKSSEPNGSGSAQVSPKSTNLPEEKEAKNPDTNGTNDSETKDQVMEKKPKAKPRRKPQ